MALTLAATMGITMLSGCGPKNPVADTTETGVPQVVVHNLAVDPQTIDPALNEAVDGAQVIHTAFEGLCRTDKNEKATPGVAESWEISEDGMTYTFKLRDSNWSDGQPVTAHDFEYSWKRVVDPATAAAYAYQMYYIKNAVAINSGEMDKEELGVKAIDDKTLEVVLEAPTPYFLELAAFPCYFPVRKDVVEADPEGWALNMETYISNGPFKITSWAHNSSLIAEKNPEYYNADAVKLDKIEYVMITEASTAFASFEAGEIDFTENPPPEQIVKKQAEGDPNFQILPYIGTYFYVFNMNDELMQNKELRKALSLAIDRTAIVENVTKAGQIPATKGFCPPGLALSTGEDFAEVFGETIYGPTADIEGAKAALEAAGYPNGEGLPTIEVVYNTNEGHKAIAEAIQEMWKQNLGLDITLRNEEWAVFQDSRKNGQYKVARHGWIGDYPDPMTFLDMWVSTSGSNDAKYNNPEYDRLINESKFVGGAERDAIILEAQRLLTEDMPVMPIYYYTNAVMFRTNIKNVYKSSLGPVVYINAYVE